MILHKMERTPRLATQFIRESRWLPERTPGLEKLGGGAVAGCVAVTNACAGAGPGERENKTSLTIEKV